ncbi:interleukin-17 receptor D [Electrophorus electricus]|uniref:interleukin-17 receptor D n=1 Tax=Electrophorus electricus TaxID=8005 RepID=UPI0015D03E3F|nr:interleukin-17 receptor D [Electrophorus electricus]
MWPGGLPLALIISLDVLVGSEAGRTSFRPRNCTLLCVQQGAQGCEYCRISEEDVQATLGSVSASLFGGCVPWPCHSFLGRQTPESCQHYVAAPRNVSVDFVDSQDPEYDAVVVSWSPSHYGFGFLQGFQVTLQALGGTHIKCQLYLIQNNGSFSATHAQRVYYSDPFSDLSLGTQYAVTVLALPVPEIWDKFHHSTLFFTRSCPEKNGLDHCKTDWYPRHVEVHQQHQDVVVTFNLAPDNFAISRYFSMCFGGGSGTYHKIIQPDLSVNRTHHTFHWLNLRMGTNYTCEIAADIVDAVRRSFFVQVPHNPIGPASPPRTMLLYLGLPVAAALAAIFALVCQKRLRRTGVLGEKRAEIIEECYETSLDEHQCVELTQRPHPPQLLICYSSNDGPAHIKVVLRLATFVQKHMATQVHLDLWDTLRIMEDGILGWYWKRMKESDFVLVIRSRGWSQSQQRRSEEDPEENTSLAILAMLAEEMCRTKALCQDLSKYMTAVFEYSQESDSPSIFSLASRYTLPEDLALLFSHLHGVALQKPGVFLQIRNISDSAYSELPAGAMLLQAIQEVLLDA